MRTVIVTLSNWADQFCKKGIIFTLILAFIGTTYQVFSRYVLQLHFWTVLFPNFDFAALSFAWIEELVRYLFIWMVFLGIAVVYKKKDHAKIELVTTYLPSKLKQPIFLVTEVINAAFFIFVFVQGFRLTLNTEGQLSPMLAVNMDFMYMSILSSCVFCAIHALRNILENLDILKTGQQEAAAANQER